MQLANVQALFSLLVTSTMGQFIVSTKFTYELNEFAFDQNFYCAWKLQIIIKLIQKLLRCVRVYETYQFHIFQAIERQEE